MSQSQAERVKKEFSLLGLNKIVFYILILLLPTQLGKHFWPTFSEVLGIRIDYLSPTLYATDILIIVLFLFWCKKQNFNKFFKNISSPWLIFFIYLSINTLLSNNPLLSLYGLTKVLELFFLGYYITQLGMNKKELSKIAWIIAVSVIVESLLAIAQYLHQGSLNGLLYFLGERKFSASAPGIANASINGQLLLRPYGTFPHPNVLAGYLLCMMVFIYSFFNVRKSIVKKSIKLFVLILGSIALMLTLSRVAIVLWLIMVIAVLLKKVKVTIRRVSLRATDKERGNPVVDRDCFVVHYRGAPRKDNFWVLSEHLQLKKQYLIFIMAIVILVFYFGSSIVPRLLATSITEEAFTQREELIKSAITIIKSDPLLGVGIYNFIPSLSHVQKPISGLFYFQPVHNNFLLLTAEIGIIGLLFFLFFIFKTYQRLIKAHNTRSNTLLIALSIIFVLGLFDHYFLTIQQGQLLLAFIFGLCWAI